MHKNIFLLHSHVIFSFSFCWLQLKSQVHFLAIVLSRCGAVFFHSLTLEALRLRTQMTTIYAYKAEASYCVYLYFCAAASFPFWFHCCVVGNLYTIPTRRKYIFVRKSEAAALRFFARLMPNQPGDLIWIRLYTNWGAFLILCRIFDRRVCKGENNQLKYL